jgi:hypothetical protein
MKTSNLLTSILAAGAFSLLSPIAQAEPLDKEDICGKEQSQQTQEYASQVCGTANMEGVSDWRDYTCLTDYQASLLGLEAEVDGLKLGDYSSRDFVSGMGCPGQIGALDQQLCYNLGGVDLEDGLVERVVVYKEKDCPECLPTECVTDCEDQEKEIEDLKDKIKELEEKKKDPSFEDVDLDDFEIERKEKEDDRLATQEKKERRRQAREERREKRRTLVDKIEFEGLRVGMDFSTSLYNQNSPIAGTVGGSLTSVTALGDYGSLNVGLGVSGRHAETSDRVTGTTVNRGETQVEYVSVGNPDNNREIRHEQTEVTTSSSSLVIPDHTASVDFKLVYESPKLEEKNFSVAGYLGQSWGIVSGPMVVSRTDKNTHYELESTLMQDGEDVENLAPSIWDDGNTSEMDNHHYMGISTAAVGGMRFSWDTKNPKLEVGVSVGVAAGVTLNNYETGQNFLTEGASLTPFFSGTASIDLSFKTGNPYDIE